MAAIRKRKRANGRHVWIVDYRDSEGTRRWETCATEDEAKRRRAQIELESGQAQPTPVDPHVTLKAYAEERLARRKADIATSTYRGYDTILRNHVLPAFGAKKVRKIHVGHVNEFLEKKRDAGYSKNMVRLMRATLSVVFGDAVQEGLLTGNPVAQLAKRRTKQAGTLTRAERQKTIRPLAPEQVHAALSAAWSHERRLHPYIMTLGRVGLRPSEGLALQWDDVDFGARELRVERSLSPDGHAAPTKTGTTRIVDMSAGLARVLQRLRAERAAETLKRGWPEVPPWVFCSDAGTPLDLSNVTKAWRRVLKKAELPGFRLYDLRHTFATTLLAHGAPITYVAAQMGHARPTTTLAHYAHWIPRGDKRYVDALDGVPRPARAVANQAAGSQLVANSTNLDGRRAVTSGNDWSRRSDLNR